MGELAPNMSALIAAISSAAVNFGREACQHAEPSRSNAWPWHIHPISLCERSSGYKGYPFSTIRTFYPLYSLSPRLFTLGSVGLGSRDVRDILKDVVSESHARVRGVSNTPCTFFMHGGYSNMAKSNAELRERGDDEYVLA